MKNFQTKTTTTQDDTEANGLAYGGIHFEFDVTYSRRGDEKTENESTQHSYPITTGERIKILHQLQTNTDDERSMRWITFETLNGYWVILNAAETSTITLLSDDVEEMPPYEHEEVYRAAKDFENDFNLNPEEITSDDFPYSVKLIEQAKKIVEELDESALMGLLNGVTYELKTGERVTSYLEDHSIEEIDSTFDGVIAIRPNDFIDLYSEGWHRSTNVRVGALRLIQVSLLRLNEWKLANECCDEN